MTPFNAMQAAVDIVNNSVHETNKIAATLYGAHPDGTPFAVSCTNHWPDMIVQKIGRETRIGGCSGTIHAETECILRAPHTRGASICITDPFCPNCAKNIAEAGIKHIYIDHKGFEKEWGKRRGDDFTDMSMRIVERAGIAVSTLYRKEQKIIPIITPSTGYMPTDDRPIAVLHPASPHFDQDELINLASTFVPETPATAFAAAWGVTTDHQNRILIAQEHLTVGYAQDLSSDQMEITNTQTGKYTFKSEPINRLMMASARMGIKLDTRLCVSSRIPTSRETVNMVTAGLVTLHILHPDKSRDMQSTTGLHQLTEAKIIRVI